MASSYLSRVELEVNRFAVLATYRHLLRATRIAFNGDEPTFLAARRFARQEFRSKRQLGPGTTEVAQAVEHAQGVTQILRENVVQGRHVGEDKYQLKMHEHTQRLDNETAGALKGTTKSFKDVKSSTF